MAHKLHISPLDLEKMDYDEVRSLNDILAKVLSDSNKAMSR